MSGRSDSWTRSLAFALSLVVGVLGAAQAGPTFVYNIANHETLQNGWTVTGTITTDTNSGIVGIGGTASITAWSVTLTPAVGSSFHFDSTGTSSSLATVGSINITPSAITMFQNPGNVLNQLTFLGGSNVGTLHYQRSSVTNSFFYAIAGDQYAWVGLNPVAVDMGGDPWVIATYAAPEPSTLVAAGLGGSVLLVGLRRRRKS